MSEADLSLDARSALRTLKRLLEAQENAISHSAAREVELRGRIAELSQRAEEAEERARLLERDRARLTESEGELSARVDGLRRELSDTAERLTLQAKAAEEQAQIFKTRCDALQAKAEYGDQLKDVDERLRDAEERALMFERRCDELQTKANHGERLDVASEKLLEALDRLPLTMSKAALIPGATRPEIELYGTYDWQQVMDAKLSVKQVFADKKKEVKLQSE